MRAQKLFERVRKLRAVPADVDDDVLLDWLNQVEGMILHEIYLVSVTDLTPFEEVPEEDLSVPYPYDRIYVSWMLVQVDWYNEEYERYENSRARFNTDWNDFARHVAASIRPAYGHAMQDGYYLSAYGIAVQHGYRGTEAEWLSSLTGPQGPQGPQGETGPAGADGAAELPVARGVPVTEGLVQTYQATGADLPVVAAGSNGTHTGKGKQVVFIPDRTNTTEAPTLSLNGGEAVPIRQRADKNQGEHDQWPEATKPVAAGMLMTGVPYTLTFCGKYWLVDSHIVVPAEIPPLPTSLPNPYKLKFEGASTAEYDGAAEQTVVIPKATPNPYKLNFTGAVSAEYDGSANKTVDIPAAPTALPNPYKLKFTGAATAEYDGATEQTVNLPSAPTVMTGASAAMHGKAGLVPASAAGSQDKVLHGDGTWRAVESSAATDVTEEYAASGEGTAEAFFLTLTTPGEYTICDGSCRYDCRVVEADGMLYHMIDGYGDDGLCDQWVYIFGEASFSRHLGYASPKMVLYRNGVGYPLLSTADQALTEAQKAQARQNIGAVGSVPTVMPNPYKLKFTGAVTGEYDGSAEQTINIPVSSSGGDDSGCRMVLLTVSGGTVTVADGTSYSDIVSMVSAGINVILFDRLNKNTYLLATGSSAPLYRFVCRPSTALKRLVIQWGGDSIVYAETEEGGGPASEMTGATGEAAGEAGLVPAPAAGSQDKVLHGDGTWREVDAYSKAYIDTALGSYITDIDTLIGGEA